VSAEYKCDTLAERNRRLEPALLAHAQIVFERLKLAQPSKRGSRASAAEPDAPWLEAAGAYVIADESTDFRYWLWDLDDLPPTFNIAAALAFFRYLGVVKPEAAVAAPAPAPAGDGTGSAGVVAAIAGGAGRC